MKHVVRAVVIALALTGAVASAHTSSTSENSKITVARNSALPIPMCAPDDPNACGLTKR